MVVKVDITQEDKNKAMFISLKRSEADRKNGKIDANVDTKRTSLETTIIGTLAEVVIDRAFDLVVDAPWVITDGSKKFGYDFKNHDGMTIELKSSDKIYKPYVQVNKKFFERKKRDGLLPDIFLFVEYNCKFTNATYITVLGYMPSNLITKFPIDPMKTDNQPSYHIPKELLLKPYGSVLNWRSKNSEPTPI
jgi:hypothetical protein